MEPKERADHTGEVSMVRNGNMQWGSTSN